LSSTIYKRWLIPTRNEEKTEVNTFFDNFNNKLVILKETLERNEKFLPKNERDLCQHSCKNMSGDVSVFFEFLKKMKVIRQLTVA